ncbi:MAG: pyruvate carboxylase subunit B [Chloroflexi bacterium]|nr:pyruvate carboxylase subunit B [Chloroflexota bacterium]
MTTNGASPFAADAAPVRIADITLRDGHQSILATRMRTPDILEIIRMLDDVGFHAFEVWGGATFDVMTRFLNEDPWERVRLLKSVAPKTPFMMLLRGQNLVGYRNYPDDVVHAFVREAAEVGIDIFRVFDALNDTRNFETAFEAIADSGKHIQGTVCYSVTDRHMGGPVFTRDYFVDKAKEIEKMGAHSLCVKDMAALLAPYDAYDLISALKDAVSIPIHLHTHYTSGLGQMTQLKAIEAGVDIVDTDLSPLALRTAHPATEPLVVALEGTPRDPGIDLDRLIEASDRLEQILQEKYMHLLETKKFSIIDTSVLTHQVPGGMTSNLMSQLAEADALDRLPEVLEELPRTRKDLGYPPLVTPTSQIVGIQAVQNVLFGRYELVSQQIKDYAFGLYGQPPLPMDKDVQKTALKGYERGTRPTKKRPADILDPEMDAAREATKDVARNDGDVLIYALYPVTGLRFLRWKYGLEEPPPEVGPDYRPPAADAPATGTPPADLSAAARTFNVHVGTERFQVIVDPADGQSSGRVRPMAPRAGGGRTPQPPPPAPDTPAPSTQNAPEGGALLTSPMPGLVIRYEVEVGQAVKAGDTVIVIEAMKMQNMLPSPVDGVIVELPRAAGDRVARGDILAVIGPPQDS